MNKYSKPYPTIGDLIKNKNYDYVSYRITVLHKENEDPDIFAGAFKVDSGNIIPLDGDIYDPNKEVIASEEWSDPEDGIKNGLDIVVEGKWNNK